MRKIVLAGGGTAGHIEPALSVGRRWLSEHPGDQLLFLGTKSGLEVSLIPAAGFVLATIPKVHISRKFSPSLIKIPITLFSAVRECTRHLQGADVLIGFGGYVSGPAYLAARLLRIPIVIHEANAKPGLANRFGALFTRFLAVAQPVSTGRFQSALISGLPLRSDVSAKYLASDGDWELSRRRARENFGFAVSEPLIFIFGGSQGSIAINEVIAKSREELEQRKIQIMHGVGRGNLLPATSNRYRAMEYISNMADAYLAADLVISRSGAVTCSEVNSLGRFALFIPLPIGNGEQEVNAGSLVDQGRAEILSQSNFTADWLAGNIDRLLALSASAPLAANPSDLNADGKIVALLEAAIAPIRTRG